MSKYNAKPETVVIEGKKVRFASQAEFRRWKLLKARETAGEISDLELQPKFPIMINGEKVCTYIADYRYFDRSRKGSKNQAGCRVVEDVKGIETPVFKLKKKLVEALYPGIIIDIVRLIVLLLIPYSLVEQPIT